MVQQLSSQDRRQQPRPPNDYQPPARNSNEGQVANPSVTRIAELESQQAQLRSERAFELARPPGLPVPGMYPPTHLLEQCPTESASGIPESVEDLFLGVERATLTQIIENRFKPTNIYRLLETEKEHAESQRTMNIGGIEFEQTERDGKEGDYRMSGFFKA